MRTTTGRHRITRTAKQRVMGALTERLPLKFAALFFSLVLWFIVAAEEPAAREMEVALALTTDSMVRVAQRPPDVHALVVGSGRDLLKLYATPPTIRRHFGNDSPETVVLEVRPSDVDLPSGVSARVQEVTPRSIPLRLEVQAGRSVPVRSALRLVPPPGMRIAGSPRFQPDSVYVTGQRTRVLSLDSVMTVADALALGDTTPRVRIDTTGLGVTVRPAAVAVIVPLARLESPASRPADTSSATADTSTGEMADTAAADTMRPAPRPGTRPR